jgi:hypothetical protein
MPRGSSTTSQNRYERRSIGTAVKAMIEVNVARGPRLWSSQTYKAVPTEKITMRCIKYILKEIRPKKWNTELPIIS